MTKSKRTAWWRVKGTADGVGAGTGAGVVGVGLGVGVVGVGAGVGTGSGLAPAVPATAVDVAIAVAETILGFLPLPANERVRVTLLAESAAPVVIPLASVMLHAVLAASGVGL